VADRRHPVARAALHLRPNRRRDWVRNLLAAGWCAVEGEQPDRYEARLVETPEAAEAVASYLGSLQRRSPSSQWPFPRDAPPGQIGQHLSEIAVFQLTPAQSGDLAISGNRGYAPNKEQDS
jgi:hypothetical protein